MSIISNVINACVKCIDTTSHTDDNEKSKSERELINYENFPIKIPESADEILNRFELFNKIVVDDESVPAMKNNIYECLAQVAKKTNEKIEKEYVQKSNEYERKKKNGEPVDPTEAPRKEYDPTVLTAVTHLFKDQGFSFAEISSIRDLRIYCQAHGRTEKDAKFRSGDFYGFSIIAAHNVAKQVAMDKYKYDLKLNMEIMRDIVEADKPKNHIEESIKKLVSQLDTEIFRWIEGSSDELPEVLSLETNKRQAKRIFKIKH